VYGATDEAIALLPALAAHPELELGAVFDPEARALRRRVALLAPAVGALLWESLCDDPAAIQADAALAWIVDAGIEPPFPTRFPELAARGVGRLSPAEAARRFRLVASPTWEPTSSAPAPVRPAPADPLARALAEGRPFLLFSCRVEATDPAGRDALGARTRAALARQLAAADSLLDDHDGAVLALLRDPARSPGDAAAGLARALAASLPAGISLAFGYALHPSEGSTRAALLARALTPRIRRV
jgi:hypothetical protein